MILQLAITILAVAASSAIFGFRLSGMNAAINRRFDELDGRFETLNGSDGSLRACFARWDGKLDRFAENLAAIQRPPS